MYNVIATILSPIWDIIVFIFGVAILTGIHLLPAICIINNLKNHSFQCLHSLLYLGFITKNKCIKRMLKIGFLVSVSFFIFALSIYYFISVFKVEKFFESDYFFLVIPLGAILSIIIELIDFRFNDSSAKKHISELYQQTKTTENFPLTLIYNGNKPRAKTKDALVLKAMLNYSYLFATETDIQQAQTYINTTLNQQKKLPSKRNKKKIIAIVVAAVVLLGAGIGLSSYSKNADSREAVERIEEAMIYDVKLMIISCDQYLNMQIDYDEFKTHYSYRVDAFLKEYNKINNPAKYNRKMYQYVLNLSTAINDNDLNDILEARNELAEHINY